MRRGASLDPQAFIRDKAAKLPGTLAQLYLSAMIHGLQAMMREEEP